MKSENDKSCINRVTARKPYVVPRATVLSPDQAKELLLQRTNINDPQVQSMLRQIEELRAGNKTQKAPGNKRLPVG